MSTQRLPDVLVPWVPDLLWKRAGPGTTLWMGPVVVPAMATSTRFEKVTVIDAENGNGSKLWAWSSIHSRQFLFPEAEISLPLRFEGLEIEEGISRAKHHLAERLFFPAYLEANLPPIGWSRTNGCWVLSLDYVYCWTFGPASARRKGHFTSVESLAGELDPCVALAAAVAVTALTHRVGGAAR